MRERIVGHKDILERLDLLHSRKLVDVVVWIIDEDQIHLTVFQQIHALDGCLVRDLNVRGRKTPVKAFQIRHKEVTADGITGSDPYLTADGVGL